MKPRHRSVALRSVAVMLLNLTACEPAIDNRSLDSAVQRPQATDSVGAAGFDTTQWPIDSGFTPATAGEGGWNYQQSVSADFDRDGRRDKVVVTAQVEIYKGRPLWDDGQPWQVYVINDNGTRRNLYSRRLQLGTLTMRLGKKRGDTNSVVLLEQLPHRLTVYEASVWTNGAWRVDKAFEREVEPGGEVRMP